MKRSCPPLLRGAHPSVSLPVVRHPLLARRRRLSLHPPGRMALPKVLRSMHACGLRRLPLCDVTATANLAIADEKGANWRLQKSVFGGLNALFDRPRYKSIG